MWRVVSSIGAFAALCMLQCAKLDAIGSTCGNGAVDPSGKNPEDCDGTSSIIDGGYFGDASDAEQRKLSCNSACHFACGKNSQCPSDDWSCNRSGECVKIVDYFIKCGGDGGCAGGTEIVGVTGQVKSVDMDQDGVDDLLAEPADVTAPYAVHFAITDPAKSKVTTLFPAEAASIVQSAPGARPSLVAQFERGFQVTMVHARAEGITARDLESVPFVSATVQAAGIDFLYPLPSGRFLSLVAWVHGATGDDDTLSRIDFATGTRTDHFSMPVVDQHDKPLSEHRIVVAVPADKNAPCTRLAVFTRDADDASAGRLQILRPNTKCDWSVPHGTRSVPGRYPAAKGQGAVFVSDLDGDGNNDLIVNALDPKSGASETLVLRGPLDGEFAPLLGDGEGKAHPAVVAAGKLYGFDRPALLTCHRYGKLNPKGLCLSETGEARSVLTVRFPNEDASAYPTRMSLDLEPRAAGFADLNGDGYDDVWSWSLASTGPHIFAATPTGFFSTGLVDHTSPDLIGAAAGFLDGLSSRSLVAVTEARGPGGDLTSEVRVTNGSRVAAEALTAQLVARVGARAAFSVHDPNGQGAPAAIALAACESANCSAASDSRNASSFNVTALRSIGSGWLAAPSSLGCYAENFFSSLFAFTDLHPRSRNRNVAIDLAGDTDSASSEHDTLVLTISAGNRDALLGLRSFVRWGHLRAEKATDEISCLQSIAQLSEAIAVAPASTATTSSWLALGTFSRTNTATPAPKDLVGKAYVLTPSSSPKEIAIVPDATLETGYRAIYAEAHDVDGDGNTDFVVLERKDGLDGRDRSLARPMLYMNESCANAPNERCLLATKIGGFESAAGDGLAWQRPHIDEARDPKSHEWWLATVRYDLATTTDKVVSQRFRVERTGRDIRLIPTSEKHELDPPRVNATSQQLTWGDFDGNGVLDLLYVTDRGSWLYQRGDPPQKP